MTRQGLIVGGSVAAGLGFLGWYVPPRVIPYYGTWNPIGIATFGIGVLGAVALLAGLAKGGTS